MQAAAESVGSFFSGLAAPLTGSSGSSATGATGATGANTSKNNKGKVTGLGPEIAAGNTHVTNSTATGGMGTPSQKGGRCYRKNRNRSNRNRNRRNKTRKNRK